MSYVTCYAHEYPRQHCPGCRAAREAHALSLARRAAPTPAEQGDWDVLRERYDRLDWRDRYAPAFPVKLVDEVLDAIERECRGDVG